jgi:SAM-dependent methyltransferase
MPDHPSGPDSVRKPQQPAEPAPAGTVMLPGIGHVRTIRRDCPACGSAHGPDPLLRRDLWCLYRCPNCAFVFLDPVPDYGSLSEVAAWDKTREHENARRLRERPLHKRLSQATRIRLPALRQSIHAHVTGSAKPGPVLDIGCAHGEQLMALPEQYVPFGIEIAAAAARDAQQRLASRGGRAVHAPAIEGLLTFDDDFFSAVTMSSYLEHEIEPLPVLHETHRVLAPGGIVIVKVPNFASWNRVLFRNRWCGLRYPDHVNYFTPESLTALAAQAGLETRITPMMRQPTSDNMWAVLRKAPPPRRI